MTRRQLEEYRTKKDEIRELEEKLAHLGEGDGLVGHDIINDYRTGFPQPQAVVGYDYELEQSRKRRYRKLIERNKAENKEVEEYIDSIPEPLTRRIMRMYYIDGARQEHIGRAVHLHRSRISQLLKKLCENLKD